MFYENQRKTDGARCDNAEHALQTLAFNTLKCYKFNFMFMELFKFIYSSLF